MRIKNPSLPLRRRLECNTIILRRQRIFWPKNNQQKVERWFKLASQIKKQEFGYQISMIRHLSNRGWGWMSENQIVDYRLQCGSFNFCSSSQKLWKVRLDEFLINSATETKLNISSENLFTQDESWPLQRYQKKGLRFSRCFTQMNTEKRPLYKKKMQCVCWDRSGI